MACTWVTQEPGWYYLRHQTRDIEIKRIPETRQYLIVIDGASMGKASSVEEGKRKAIKLAL